MKDLCMRLPLSCALLLSAAACSSMRPAPAGQMSHGSGTRFVTAAEIQKSGARSAWDALRATLPGLSLRETRVGTPIGIGRRGRSSIYLSSAPIVLVDFVRVSDVGVLRDIDAKDVLSIELVNGIDATTYFGTNAGSGAILVRTKGAALEKRSEPPPETPEADSTRGNARQPALQATNSRT